MGIQSQTPAHDVELVNTLVADLAIAVVPQNVPTGAARLRVSLLRIGDLRRRAEPGVPVQPRRYGIDCYLSRTGPRLVGETSRHIDPPDHALLQLGHSFHDVWAGTVLSPVLNDAVVLVGRLDNFLTFGEIVRAGLLHVDIFAGLACPDGPQCMPMIWCGETDGVNALVVQYLAHVGA